ncbi:MAG: hypothetical protein AUK47_20405 [Deltaproteobacteria bacterium CG2_30_63_29]|nr:MAG: hypothetical protein AUK47_20405 [Deltaproteobacteria bacterium CG2_30_63_29]PIW00524.1 MAG: hypothetical protein COW42_07500 [Deltaproteobacteria bacterium CG17_big_fil_post_rev_8_21_14_2_50_63_7]PJB39618.1 MAG: hypothetical protein CO108_16900 [Deltaproteobacteria bacterium CG_4_9_14_3_um_filter_63_12]
MIGDEEGAVPIRSHLYDRTSAVLQRDIDPLSIDNLMNSQQGAWPARLLKPHRDPNRRVEDLPVWLQRHGGQNPLFDNVSRKRIGLNSCQAQLHIFVKSPLGHGKREPRVVENAPFRGDDLPGLRDDLAIPKGRNRHVKRVCGIAVLFTSTRGEQNEDRTKKNDAIDHLDTSLSRDFLEAVQSLYE